MTPQQMTDYQTAALRAMRAAGGRITLAELNQTCVMPAPVVRDVMRALIIDKEIRIEGEQTYVLVDVEQFANVPAAALTPKPVQAPAPKVEAAPPAAAQKKKKKQKQKRCVRCEELLDLDQFPLRAGMIRAARICANCCPADQAIGSPADRIRAKLPATPPLQVPFARAAPPLAPAPAPKPAAPPVVVDDLVHRRIFGEGGKPEAGTHTLRLGVVIEAYLADLVSTGFFGASTTAACEQLILEGIRREIVKGPKT